MALVGTHVPIPEPMLSISQALCDRSHADLEILAEIEHVEYVWMQHCPDAGELSVEEAIDVLQISVTEDVYKQRETVDGSIKIFGRGMGGVGDNRVYHGSYAEGVMNAIE